jgi:murein DD-endopeptidase MepM/ murein hydrolase activator NlpD
MKLKEENALNFTFESGRKGLENAWERFRQRLFNDDSTNPLVGKLFKRVFALVAAFLLISPLFSWYQLTQGAYIGTLDETEGDWSGVDPVGGDAASNIDAVITEDGFLLKPAINTTQGDRSGFSDIFVYTVEQGDNLSTIADRFGIKKDTLMAENNLWDANKLKVGSQLRILPVDGLSYMARKGDTVEKLAKKFKVEKEAILKQNHLEADKLEEGLVVIVPGAKRDQPVYIAGGNGTPGNAPAFAPGTSVAKAVGRLIWPCAPGAVLTQSYKRGHTALDIANPARGPIYAAAAGKVVKAKYGWNGGYGNVIIIDHGNGMQTLYGHNEKLYVTEGQYVDQGQTISWMGNTGNVRGRTGIHLHFEVRINGVKYNPQNFF